MVSCLPVYWDGEGNERTQGKGRKISWTKAGSMLGHRRSLWPNMEPTLVQRMMFAGVHVRSRTTTWRLVIRRRSITRRTTVIISAADTRRWHNVISTLLQYVWSSILSQRSKALRLVCNLMWAEYRAVQWDDRISIYSAAFNYDVRN